MVGAILSVVLVPHAWTAGLSFGEIVFSQDGAGSGAANAVLKANVATGERSVISQFGVRGSGVDFGSLIGGMSLDYQGNILLTGFSVGGVFQIDPVTGDRAVLSGVGVGTGPGLDGANDLIIGSSGEIFVSAGTAGAIVRVDPLTGNRSLISGAGRGSGPLLEHPFGLTQTATGNFYAFDANLECVFFINGFTGDRTIISGNGIGAGEEFSGFGLDLVQLPDGDLVVSDLHSLIRVDPFTGNRSLLTGSGVGNGPDPGFLNFLNITFDGRLLSSSATDGVLFVDPASGNRTMITGGDYGFGPEVGLYREAVLVPEPASLALVALLTLLIAAERRRR